MSDLVLSLRKESFTAMLGFVLVAFGGTLLSTQSVAEDVKTCPPPEPRRALNALHHVTDWQGFYDSYNHFSRCDSKRVAEEFSYVLSRLLANDWKGVDLLLRLAASSPDFREFVLKHIDENAPEEEAQSIIRNAQEHCPSNGEWLCRAIVDY